MQAGGPGSASVQADRSDPEGHDKVSHVAFHVRLLSGVGW